MRSKFGVCATLSSPDFKSVEILVSAPPPPVLILMTVVCLHFSTSDIFVLSAEGETRVMWQEPVFRLAEIMLDDEE